MQSTMHLSRLARGMAREAWHPRFDLQLARDPSGAVAVFYRGADITAAFDGAEAARLFLRFSPEVPDAKLGRDLVHMADYAATARGVEALERLTTPAQRAAVRALFKGGPPLTGRLATTLMRRGWLLPGGRLTATASAVLRSRSLCALLGAEVFP